MRGPQQREMRNAFPQAKEVGVGAQHRGFPKESQRTRQVGVGPNTEKCETHFHKQRKLSSNKRITLKSCLVSKK